MALTVLGLPDIEAEENFEEDSHKPLIHGAENEDEYEPNYSIQEDSTITQVKAISFYQACCLPGVLPVRTVQISLPQPVRYCDEILTLPGIKHLQIFSLFLILCFRNFCLEEYCIVPFSLFLYQHHLKSHLTSNAGVGRPFL